MPITSSQLNAVERCIKWLWPPKPPKPGEPPLSDEVMYAWRRKIATAFYLEALAMLILWLWVIGLTPAFVPAPAFSTDLNALRQDLARTQRLQEDTARELRLGQLQPALDMARENHCRALQAPAHLRNQDSITLYLDRLRREELQYFRLMGQWPKRENCEDILVPVPAAPASPPAP